MYENPVTTIGINIFDLMPIIISIIGTGIISIAILITDKRAETRKMTRDLAHVLCIEIERMMRTGDLDELNYQYVSGIRFNFGVDVYRGLLRSGNIRYFDTVLQKKLSEIYAMFQVDRLVEEYPRCLLIMEQLETIQDKNRGYRYKIKRLLKQIFTFQSRHRFPQII